MSDLFNRCQLKGDELDAEVSRLEDTPHLNYSTNWLFAGPIIERDHIFLTPPSDEHVNGGPNAGWNRYPFWRATVSSNTRRRPNPSGSELAPMTVGRGAGPTALMAAMRAYVDSKAIGGGV